MVIPVFPFMSSAPAIVGCVMMIGTGENTLTMAPVAVAPTVAELIPMNDSRGVFTLLCTLTRRRFTGSLAERLALGTPTVPALGKSMLTVSPDPLNPFRV